MWLKDILNIIVSLISSIIIIVSVLLALAYLTLAERKVMGSMQRRVGPNVVGIYGLGQPIMDGVKLVLKEGVVPIHANKILYSIAPIGSLILALIL
jgi:NADH:ubiquinone oxidoreductase subunit H